MQNQISYQRVIDTVFAMSALGTLTGNRDLPGPLGRHEEDAIRELAVKAFTDLCAEINRECDGENGRVELPGNHRAELEAIVTDRVICGFTGRTPDAGKVMTLKARIRSVPTSASRFY